jgi:hypothetical protein
LSTSRPKGRKAILSSAVRSRKGNVLLGARRLIDQVDLLQIGRRVGRERNEIADRFMEAVIGAAAIEPGLILVGALVVIVPELVVNGG